MLRNFFSGCSSGRLIDKYSRGRFENNVNYIVSLCAASVGLGDVLGFPAYAARLENGTFVIPFLFYIVFVGIPLVTLELFLGQFTSSGPMDCWKFSPIFRGVGFGTVFVVTIVMVFYQVELAIAVFYLFKSFAVTLPWKHCDREWASDFCLDFLNKSSDDFCRDQGWNVSSDGACYNDTATPRQIKSLWNTTLAAENEIRRVVPAYEYYHHFVLGGNKPGISLFNLGNIHSQVFGCLVVVWIIVAAALWWGLKSLTKILTIAMVYIFLALAVQLVVVLTMDGAIDGIKSFVRVDFQSLGSTELWLDAMNLTIFTLSVSAGVLLSLASFHSVQGDCCTFASVMSAINVVISLLSGGITFAVLGSLSKILGEPISQIKGINQIGFIVYPHALASFSGGAVWSVGFFFMVIFAGLSPTIVGVHTVHICILDLFPVLRPHKEIVLATICTIYCLLGLPLLTDGGPHLSSILKDTVSSFIVFLLALLECIALAWVYGNQNLFYDISFIIGDKTCGILPWKFMKYAFAVSWTVLVPIVMIVSIVVSLKRAFAVAGTLEGALQLVLSCIIMSPLPIFAVKALMNRKKTCLQKLRSAYRPTEGWGPLAPKLRSKWLTGTKLSLPVSRFGASALDIERREEISEELGKAMTDIHTGNPAVSASRIELSGLLAGANAVNTVMGPHRSTDRMIPVTEPHCSTDVTIQPESSTDKMILVTRPECSTDKMTLVTRPECSTDKIIPLTRPDSSTGKMIPVTGDSTEMLIHDKHLMTQTQTSIVALYTPRSTQL